MELFEEGRRNGWVVFNTHTKIQKKVISFYLFVDLYNIFNYPFIYLDRKKTPIKSIMYKNNNNNE